MPPIMDKLNTNQSMKLPNNIRKSFRNVLVLKLPIATRDTFLCLALVVMGNLNLSAQFLGGNGSALTRNTLTQTACTFTGSSPYLGGVADGFSLNKLTQTVCVFTGNNPYLGGVADGFTLNKLIQTVCTFTGDNPYLGGVADGFTLNKLIQTACTFTGDNPYLGGVADGFSLNKLIQTACVFTGNSPYLGGTADGFSLNTLTQTACVFTGNSPYFGGTADGQSFSDCGCGGWCAVGLPIDLLYFDAILQPDKTVLCKWETETEINNDYFTIEKTTDGTTLEFVANINGAGNSNTALYYDATDNNPYYGISYYRLKQTDYNGDYSYSELRPINLEGLDIINFFPNPAEGHIDVLLYSSVETTVNINLYNLLGQAVTIASQMKIEKGLNKLYVDVSSFSMGYYMLEAVTDSGLYQSQKKLIKK